MSRVGPTEDNPTHHIKLTDSSATEVPLITTDPVGNKIPTVSVNPYPAMASQLRQGRSKHADRVPPFEDIAIDDFSGGLGLLHHDKDSSKYLDGWRMDTSQPGRVTLGGKATYTTGIRDLHYYLDSTGSDWQPLYTSPGTSSLTTSVTISGTWEADKVVVRLKKEGSPTGNVTVYLLDSASAEQKSQTFNAANLTTVGPYAVEFDWTGTETVSDGETWKIKVEYDGGDSSNLVRVLCGGDGTKPVFLLLDDTTDYSIIPFEYRGGFYCVTQPENRGVSKLYQLGTRGVATGFTASQLTVAGTDFSSSGYTVASGDLVKIIAGPGSEEDQPWRQASGNGTNGAIPVSPDWNVTHTVNTEYVVITDEWELLDTLDYYCTDVSVTDRVIHLAGGGVHHRVRFGNDDGTWTFEGDIGVDEVQDAINSDKLLAIRHDGYAGERPVFDLYSSQLQTHSNTDLIEPSSIKTLRTPPYFGAPFYLLGELTDNSSWSKNEYTNIDQYADKGWAAIDIAAAFTTGNIAAKTLDPPIDISEAELIYFAIKTDFELPVDSLALTLGDGADTFKVTFPDTSVIPTGDDMHDEFRWYELPIHADGAPISGSDYPDWTKIDRLVLSVETEFSAQAVNIKIGQDGMLLATRNPNNERYKLGLTERVNNMVEYGGGAGQVTRKPWVGTNKNVYYIEGGQLKPIYLREIGELEHHRNCEMMVVNDVYLYFNQEEKIQRYYSGRLDNVGPDVDYGLPEDRRGIPCSGATYPGRVYAAIDAGSSGTSSVIFRKNHGWHEAYRALVSGYRIKNIHIFGRPDTTDRMYVSEGADVLWLPVSLNPEEDSDYSFANLGNITTSRIYGGLRETEKYFHAITLLQKDFQDFGVTSPPGYIYISYKTSENPDDWVPFASNFSCVPHIRRDITSDNDTTGRWIQFAIEFTGTHSFTPVLIALVIDALERLDSISTYSYNIRLKAGYDHQLGIDSPDESKSGGLTGKEKFTQLQTWIDDPKPLTLNSNSTFEDGKLVFIEPERSRVLYSKLDDKKQEVRIYQLTLIEVE